MHFLTISLGLANIWYCTLGCYLFGENNSGNCIGKRALSIQPGSIQDKDIATRMCPSCGEGGVGECYSATICCHPTSGCVTSTNLIHMSTCHLEHSNASTPCRNSHRLCSVGSNLGLCQENLCCTTETCSEHKACADSLLNSPIDARQRRMDEVVENLYLKRSGSAKRGNKLPFGIWGSGKRAHRVAPFRYLRSSGMEKRPFSWRKLAVSAPLREDSSDTSRESSRYKLRRRILNLSRH